MGPRAAVLSLRRLTRADRKPEVHGEPCAGPMTDREPPTWTLALHLWRLSRPEIWVLSWFPLYVGRLLASRELVPSEALIREFLLKASGDGATMDEFLRFGWGWFVAEADFLLASIVMGPLLWAATILINDVHDLRGDRLNARKARSPLVQGLVDRGTAHAWAYVFAVLALAGAAAVGLTFLLLVFGCLLLAWAYSVPPLRWKTVPGADVLVNAVGVGILAGLAGWVLEAPLLGAPFEFIPQSLLVAVAIYVPTTLVDYEADLEAGYRTIATRLGVARAYRLGFAAWVLANLGALLLAWNGWILPRAMLPFLLVFCPLLVWEYHYLIGKARDPVERLRGITVATFTFLAVNAIFALMYTGWWA